MEWHYSEMKNYYEQFRIIVEQVAADPNEQLERLKGTLVADEIALDFCEIGLFYAKNLFEQGWLTKEQITIISMLKLKFEQMSLNKDLWNDEAVLGSKEWEECRNMGIEILQTMQVV